MTTLKSLTLDNGLRVDFIDRTNRYFGDYHRVVVEASISFELPEDEDSDDCWQQARAVLGDRLMVRRTLERMAVPSDEVETVRQHLIDDFLLNAGSYLGRPEFLKSQVDAELKKRRRGRFY